MVTTPETIHAISSQKGELTVRKISADTMKMPDPIIEPATSIVASVSVSALTNSRDDAAVSAVAVVVVKACPQVLGFSPVFLPCTARRSYRRPGVFASRPTDYGLSPQSVALKNEMNVDGVSHRGPV